LTPISWKITTTANSKWVLPFEAFPISIWNPTTGANVTVTPLWDLGRRGGAAAAAPAAPLASLASASKANRPRRSAGRRSPLPHPPHVQRPWHHMARADEPEPDALFGKRLGEYNQLTVSTACCPRDARYAVAQTPERDHHGPTNHVESRKNLVNPSWLPDPRRTFSPREEIACASNRPLSVLGAHSPRF
jgi:hypothetical protein